MEIKYCYKILQVSPGHSDAEIASSYKKLAFKYHPDRNPDKSGRAHEIMTELNTAYSTLMSHRFTNPPAHDEIHVREAPRKKAPKMRAKPAGSSEAAAQAARERELEDEYLFKVFVKLRDDAKEQLYKFFQYNLYNLARRDNTYNRGIYNRIVIGIRKSYHIINAIETRTTDPELLEHFAVFKKMIFTFYTASECLNVNDNYKDQYEVDAYRSYKKGDDALTKAMKELFYDRHNRGFLKRELVNVNIMDAQYLFVNTIHGYPKSTWLVEARIKLQFTEALIAYYRLFFTE